MGEGSCKRLNSLRKNFKNPEIKISYNILLIVMTIFFIINIITINLDYQKRKKEYIGIMGTIIAKITKKNPSLADEIAPIMTSKLTEKEKINGIKKIQEYGLYEQLDLSLFPNLNQNYYNYMFSVIFINIILIIILIFLNYIQYSYFYSIIRNFTNISKNILNGEYNIGLNKYKEGDVAKLECSFYSMAEVLKGNINKLNKEKIFLINILQDISHQLKTPLSTLILYNDIMLDKDLSKDEVKIFLENSQKQLVRMKNLVVNLLKQAKLDAGAVNFEIKEQSLNETIDEVIDILYGKIIEKNISLKFICDKEIYLRYDRLWLQEAFVNLVKNAIEHSTKYGEVKIVLEDNPLYTRVIINNKGDIIYEEDLPNIFKRFYKCKNSNKEDTIGIGLSLSKSIIEKHDGYIEVKSNIEEGTTFTITFLKY